MFAKIFVSVMRCGLTLFLMPPIVLMLTIIASFLSLIALFVVTWIIGMTMLFGGKRGMVENKITRPFKELLEKQIPGIFTALWDTEKFVGDDADGGSVSEYFANYPKHQHVILALTFALCCLFWWFVPSIVRFSMEKFRLFGAEMTENNAVSSDSIFSWKTVSSENKLIDPGIPGEVVLKSELQSANLESLPNQDAAIIEDESEIVLKQGMGAPNAPPLKIDPQALLSADAVQVAEGVESAAVPREDLPYGQPVVGQKGFVYSPYAPDKGQVDVNGIPAGTNVKCPYTGKLFRIP